MLFTEPFDADVVAVARDSVDVRSSRVRPQGARVCAGANPLFCPHPLTFTMPPNRQPSKNSRPTEAAK